MTMPRMTGHDFISQAKKHPFGQTKFYIITAGITASYSKEKEEMIVHISEYVVHPDLDGDEWCLAAYTQMRQPLALAIYTACAHSDRPFFSAAHSDRLLRIWGGAGRCVA